MLQIFLIKWSCHFLAGQWEVIGGQWDVMGGYEIWVIGGAGMGYIGDIWETSLEISGGFLGI